MGPLLNGAGDLVTKTMKKAEILGAFSALVFTGKICPQQCQVPETSGKNWSKDDFSSVEEDQIREHVNKLGIHKSMGPEGMYPQVLAELTSVTMRTLSITFERSW